MSQSSTYLVGLMLGPVQGFIAAARRTRDLWYGSFLLSEVSKSAARAFHEEQGRLIFPAPFAPDKDLAPDSEFNVANKVVAMLETADAAQALQLAKEAALERWRCLARRCLDDFPARHLRRQVWDLQVDDILETYGAWVRVDDAGAYRERLARLNVLLAARKATRDFAPAATDPREAPFPDPREAPFHGLPKSSLDAARETVLEKLADDAGAVRTRTAYGIDANEQLDCPGLVKRVNGRDHPFTALTRVALDPWIKKAQEIDPQALMRLNDAYAPLVGSGLATKARGVNLLPFDASLVYASRLEQAKKDAGGDQATLKAVEAVEAAKKPLLENEHIPAPVAYAAILIADGDRMGEFIDAAPDRDSHRSISEALAGFAGNAASIVKDHGGQCVYSGGDDVLAFLPTDCAIACASKLAGDFADRLSGVRDRLVRKLDQSPNAVQPVIVPQPTLSVGLGIGHVLASLGSLRALATRAERLAKDKTGPLEKSGERNALGIVVSPRSGSELSLRGNWDEPIGSWWTGFADRIEYWIARFQAGDLPDRAPYQLRDLRAQVSEMPSDLVASEVMRLLGRRRDASGKKMVRDLEERIAKMLDAFGGPTRASVGLARLTDELLLARWFAQHTLGGR